MSLGQQCNFFSKSNYWLTREKPQGLHKVCKFKIFSLDLYLLLTTTILWHVKIGPVLRYTNYVFELD